MFVLQKGGWHSPIILEKDVPNTIMNMDIFYAINGLAYKSPLLDSIMVFCSRYLPYFFILLLATIFLIGLLRKDESVRTMAASAVIFTALNLLISFLIGLVYFSPRPFVTYQHVNLLYHHAADTSFPSDHVTATFSIALGLGMFNRFTGWFLTILSILIGISRIYVGHHYPTDVLGAFIIVGITGYIYNRYLKNLISYIYLQIDRKIFSR